MKEYNVDREATKLRTEQRSSVLSHDWMDILSEEEKRKFINRSKSIHPEDTIGLYKLLHEIKTSPDKTEDELVEDSFGFFKLLDEITTSPDKTEDELVEGGFFDEEDSEIFFPASNMFRGDKEILTQSQSPSQLSGFNNFINQGTVSNIPAGMVTYQFGIVGLLTFIKAAETDPNLIALAPGMDLTTLGLNLNSPENLYSTFQSLWVDMPCRPQDIDFHVPAEYLTNIFIRDKVISASVKEGIMEQYISISNKNPDRTRELFVTKFNRKKEVFLFNSGQYSEAAKVAANPPKSMDVSSEKRSSLMEKYDAGNKRKENNHHCIGANVKSKLRRRNRHYGVADINLKSIVFRVMIYRAVMGNGTYRMMISIDTLESVAFDLLGPEWKRVFFDLLNHRLHYIESSATISDLIPNMIEPTDIQEVIYFSVHELSMINRLTTLLLSCPDGERLRQRSKQEFISLIQAVVAATFKETTTRRHIFFMVDSEVFERALEGISQDFVNNSQPEERAIVPVVDNVRCEGNGSSETIVSRPVQCIYFPSDCRLFIYIPTENGSYWHQLDMQRASRLNPTSPAVTNP